MAVPLAAVARTPDAVTTSNHVIAAQRGDPLPPDIAQGVFANLTEDLAGQDVLLARHDLARR